MEKIVDREFPTIQELSNGFSEFRLEQSKELLGREVTLYYEDGHQVIYKFLDHESLKITYKYKDKEEVYASVYTLVSPRENIYMVDFIQSFGDTKSVTTIINLNRKIATTLTGILPSKEEVAMSQFERGDKGLPLTSVTAEFEHASVDKTFDEFTEKHEFTTDLIGKRISFKYSSNDTYEHIYLNDKYYTWHCMSGIEKGLCDTDRCFYLKLDDNLYWFTWIEKVVPTVGTVIEDLNDKKMRSYGKIYGYETYEMGKVTNFQIGSYATEINSIKYK